MAVRTLDLFCGGGGSSWGAQAAGAQIVGGIDAWRIAVDTFASNFPDAKAFNCVLTEATDPSQFDEIGSVDLLLASPECTNHTWARGSRPINELSRQTASYIVAFARHFRPRWVVLENVVSMAKWDGHHSLLVDLRSLGYEVTSQTIDASHVGVPQTRRRLFLLCELGQALSKVELGDPGSFVSASKILAPEATYRSRPLFDGSRADATIKRAERAIDALGRKVPFLIVYYGSDGSGGWQPLTRPLRTLTTLDRFGLVTWQGRTAMLRMLQPDELVRAMGFDRVGSQVDYRLHHGTRRDRIKLLGNGVCPPVMQKIVTHLMGTEAVSIAAE